VRKINIDTDNRMAMTGAVRKALAEKPGDLDPRAWLKPAKEAMRKVCQQRFQEFGCEGMASGIKPMSNAQMAKRYASGDLDPVYGRELKAAS
jgi:fructose-bisphosphate aldolase class II